MNEVKGILSKIVGDINSEVLQHISFVVHSMLLLKNLKTADWKKAYLTPYFNLVAAKKIIDDAITKAFDECAQHVEVEEAKEEVDDVEQLCDCTFSLAYGNKGRCRCG